MEIKIGITDIAREVVIESNATPEEVTNQLREAIANDSLFELVDERDRRLLIPAKRIGYLDLGSATTRAVGFGAV